MIPLKDIFELEKEIKLKKSSKHRKEERLVLLKNSLEPKATDLSKERVSSSSNDSQKIDIYAEIVKMEDDIKLICEELDSLKSEAEEKRKIFEQFNDRDKEIYIEKKLCNWSNAKISVKHGGISRWTIKRIVQKIQKEMKK